MDIEDKYRELQGIIKGLKTVLVAFSGGTDSTLLLKVSIDMLGRDNVLAFIGSSPICPGREIEEAKMLSDLMGAEYVIEKTSEMEDPDFIANTTSRCFFCKTRLFEKAWEIAEKRGFHHIAEGSNLDDMDDFRPGRRACLEQHIVSPLLTAGLKKKEIRELSRRLSLPTYNKPPFACLSTRIPYGIPISVDILRKIECSEEAIKELGIRQVRVRYHGDIARIEVMKEDLDIVIAYRKDVIAALRQYGFAYITLDLEGYTTGSMNIRMDVPSP